MRGAAMAQLRATTPAQLRAVHVPNAPRRAPRPAHHAPRAHPAQSGIQGVVLERQKAQARRVGTAGAVRRGEKRLLAEHSLWRRVCCCGRRGGCGTLERTRESQRSGGRGPAHNTKHNNTHAHANTHTHNTAHTVCVSVSGSHSARRTTQEPCSGFGACVCCSIPCSGDCATGRAPKPCTAGVGRDERRPHLSGKNLPHFSE